MRGFIGIVLLLERGLTLGAWAKRRKQNGREKPSVGSHLPDASADRQAATAIMACRPLPLSKSAKKILNLLMVLLVRPSGRAERHFSFLSMLQVADSGKDSRRLGYLQGHHVEQILPFPVFRRRLVLRRHR
ncbi:hypothetical protein D16iCDA_11530 [Pseudomonas seleniipraecipitans]|uniref:Secreted protein n=1 Tax=Phytopseudomonas seleniipraecipitans TaxID=640205 RepID=A0ABY5JE19_9GAMM|nr:hypothetical protein [Pseudomonas seleniipraecipitans]UUD66242.1 hypothetical protein D16iCDA_11530 [Pseudomonas seleniipraecipitans]